MRKAGKRYVTLPAYCIIEIAMGGPDRSPLEKVMSLKHLPAWRAVVPVCAAVLIGAAPAAAQSAAAPSKYVHAYGANFNQNPTANNADQSGAVEPADVSPGMKAHSPLIARLRANV